MPVGSHVTDWIRTHYLLTHIPKRYLLVLYNHSDCCGHVLPFQTLLSIVCVCVMCVCVHACVCVCVHVCLSLCVCICMHVRGEGGMCVCVCVASTKEGNASL